MSERRNKEMLDSLKERFVDGEKLTVEQMIQDYFSPKSAYSYLVAKKVVKGVISSLKHWFRRKEGLWFGNIDSAGHYGLFTDEEEVRYGMIRYYRFVKGVLFNARLLVDNARAQGLLPANIKEERMLVAKIEEEEENGH